MNSGWELLQKGEIDAALMQLQLEREEDPFYGAIHNLAIGYLCANRPAKAADALKDAFRLPYRSAATSALFGVTRWLLDDPHGAVRNWKDGLDAQYADAAGGIDLPLLLFFAATRLAGSFDLNEAERLLAARLKSPRADCNWPAPIARFLLGRISEEELRAEAKRPHPLVAKRQTAQAEFYLGLAALRSGERERFLEQMRICADAPLCELVSERYLARKELADAQPE